MRKKILINGTVQGVGFRPFVYRMALQSNITGFISNTDSGVLIEAQGSDLELTSFQENIEKYPPPLSFIQEISINNVPENGDLSFSIIETIRGNAELSTAISPDVGTCPDCNKDILSSKNRRYRYPFTNCTNCGPRYTIISQMPYDRPYTTMKFFKMCNSCVEEYNDPLDRRFHAQPNACPECGPKISLTDKSGKKIKCHDPIKQAIQLLMQGKILAIKGLGGYHLAVDARLENSVLKLRNRKNREEKPLALMAKDIGVIKKFCKISTDEEECLKSAQSPIVLLDKSAGETSIAPSISPNNTQFGLMLPYTPLHTLLLAEDLDVLVMTSANLSEEPICITNEEAYNRLDGIADYFLTHNRDVLVRSDDSIISYTGNKLRLIRRSRGYVPQPFYLNSTGPTVLGAGCDLKNTLCFLKNDQAIMSQHIGDLENLKATEFYTETEKHLRKLYNFSPDLIVHDLHPAFFSTNWAEAQNLPVLGVQHHHAHMASVIAEYRLDRPVIGLIWDGTGLGTDNTIWGGEILTGDLNKFERFAAFETFLLPGGDSAIREPWKLAVSSLVNAFGYQNLPDLPFIKEHSIDPLLEIMQKGINSVQTSSAGRLFDAVAAMAGGRQKISYEGQAAIELMNQVDSLNVKPYSYKFEKVDNFYQIASSSMIKEISNDILAGKTLRFISNRFHKTMIDLLVDITVIAQKETGINDVVINGGVFQNHIILNGIVEEFSKRKISFFIPEIFPLNDGGISLGQAVIGREFLNNH